MDNPRLAGGNPLASLRKLGKLHIQRCDICNGELRADHEHLVEPSTRRVVCGCDACAIIFHSQGGAQLMRVPRLVRFLPNFHLTDDQWRNLMIPIDLAFFFESSKFGKVVAFYPSPAGPVESILELSSWSEIVHANPVLNEMSPDVEALLVNRTGSTREYFLAPITECYRLIGLIRMRWRGFSGGTELWKSIEQFFNELKLVRS